MTDESYVPEDRLTEPVENGAPAAEAMPGRGKPKKITLNRVLLGGILLLVLVNAALSVAILVQARQLPAQIDNISGSLQTQIADILAQIEHLLGY